MNKFLLGGDYNPEQWQKYPDILEQDYNLFKKAHINTVTAGVFGWSTLEPIEGEYHFEYLDEVFKRMEEIDGYVILATPSGARPQWMSEKYIEVNRVDEYGRRHHHGFRHNHCFSSPIYREKVKKINEALSQRYGHHPRLLMWHISNEYSGECYCALCQKRFRDFIKEKYKTLEALNEAYWAHFWSGTYTSWSQVVPPSPLGESKSHGLDLDWKIFNTKQIINFYQEEVKAVRKYSDKPVTTNFMAEGDEDTFIPLEGIDYHLFSKYVDVVSWDSYPSWHNPHEPLYLTAMKTGFIHDLYYSMKHQPFIVMESTPSVVNSKQFNKSKRPGMNILSSFQQIAHGSDSTLYFQLRQSRGHSEKYHGAVIGHDGKDTNRVYQEVCTYGKRLESISEIKGAIKKPKVAIILDYKSNWMLKRGGGFGRPTRRYFETLQEHYRIFFEKDIQVDIISVDDDFTPYKLLIAPMLYSMSLDTMHKLQSYTSQGGCLISSYFTGMVNENDLVNLGWPEPLRELFGIEIEELETLYPQEHNEITYQNITYQTLHYSSIIQSTHAKALSFYLHDFYAHTPSLTCNMYGKGKAYYIAARTNVDFLRDFYDTLINDYHLNHPIVIDQDKEVSIQSRMKGSSIYYFVMNFSETTKQITFIKPLFNIETNKYEKNLLLSKYEVRIYKEKRPRY